MNKLLLGALATIGLGAATAGIVVVAGVVDVGADTVSPCEEYFFDFTAHFAVSDDRCFHWLKGILRYIIANIAIRRRNKK